MLSSLIWDTISVYCRITLPQDRCFWSSGRFFWTLFHCYRVWGTSSVAANTGIATYGAFHQVSHVLSMFSKFQWEIWYFILNVYLPSDFSGLNLLIKGCWLRPYSTKMKWYVHHRMLVWLGTCDILFIVRFGMQFIACCQYLSILFTWECWKKRKVDHVYQTFKNWLN